jgi:hypothetical protein
LVDPLDGTANFIAGSSQWAVMVALLQGNETTAAWIWQPAADAMYQAQAGAGAERNGRRIVPPSAPSEIAELRGGGPHEILGHDHASQSGRQSPSFRVRRSGDHIGRLRLSNVGRRRAKLCDIQANAAVGPRAGCPHGQRIRRLRETAQWRRLLPETNRRRATGRFGPRRVAAGERCFACGSECRHWK